MLGGKVGLRAFSFARELNLTVAMGIEKIDPDKGVVCPTHVLAGPDGYTGKQRKTYLMLANGTRPVPAAGKMSLTWAAFGLVFMQPGAALRRTRTSGADIRCTD